MIVTRKDKKAIVAFEEILPGEVFEYGGVVYMKIRYPSIGEYRAIELESGDESNFDIRTQVTMLDAELIVRGELIV